MALVFDIETIGAPFDSLPESVQEYLLRPAGGDLDKQEDLKCQTALLPFTGEVVCIAMHNTHSGGGKVIFRPGSQELPAAAGVVYSAFEDERSLLREFWALAARGRPYVTFNGRAFDVPYLYIRSGILEVKATCDLLGNRYKSDTHVDLYDQFKFQGSAWSMKFNLDLACKSFGIESPKSEGTHGNKVQEMWVEGRGADIARYCYGDVVATAALFARWRDFMNW